MTTSIEAVKAAIACVERDQMHGLPNRNKVLSKLHTILSRLYADRALGLMVILPFHVSEAERLSILDLLENDEKQAIFHAKEAARLDA